MITYKNTYNVLLKLMIFLFPLFSLGQTIHHSYESLWNVIQTDTISKAKKLQHLNIYIQKAQKEKNLFEEYKAIDKKTEYIPTIDAITLSDKALSIAELLKNDSLIENSLSTKASYLFLNRDFKEALNYTLKAESYNLKTNNLYSLNAIRLDISYIYFYLKDYEKAKEYILKAKNYYKYKNEPAHIQSYIVSLYNLSKTYWQLNNIDSLQVTIHEANKTIPFLDKNDQILESPYFNYVTGGLYFLKGDYHEAEKFLLKALTPIKSQGDFTNEHIIYLYLGKIYWNQNDKEKAIDHFTKIDELFKTKKFLNYELRETYDYLITYYKETNQLQLQLQATENLIALNLQFEKEQRQLTNTLHYELETKKLEYDRDTLEKQLLKNKNKYIILLLLSSILIFISLGYGMWKYKQKKQLRLSFETLIQQKTLNHFQENNHAKILNINTESKLGNSKYLLSDLTPTELRILNELEIFEKEKKFLFPIRLEDFATQLGSNRNTLSQIINKYKKDTFTNYINRLRIQQVISDLKKHTHLRKFSMQGLAETYGFGNARTFSNQFKTQTDLTPAYFIKQLELNDLEKKKEQETL